MNSTLRLSNPENTPGLTKLWNRSHGAGRLEMELKRGQRDREYRFAILLVQFDGLSRATDRLGHASGEGVWRRVLGVLTDDLGVEDLCCRLGGDEFLLILPERGESESRVLVERLLRHWNAAPTARESALEVSIGIASYPAQGSTVEGLFAAADEAMHADKDRNHAVRSADGLRRVPQ